MKIETERLILRTIDLNDAKDMFDYSRDEEVAFNAGWSPHKNMMETVDIMNTFFIGKAGMFGIVLKENGKMIGSIGFADDAKRQNPKVKMLGYAMGKNYWGKGYMTEAAKAAISYGFDKMMLDAISAYTYPENSRSKNVLIKNGFKYEGTLSLCEETYKGLVKDNDCYIKTRY